MTIQEIKNLPNGTRVFFDGDNITRFYKKSEGIFCDYPGWYYTMPWELVEWSIKRWALEPFKVAKDENGKNNG